MKIILLSISILFVACSTAVGGDCGKSTSEKPASASTSVYVDGGKLHSLNGVVLYPNGEEAVMVIAELYRNNLNISVNEKSYEEVGQILKENPIAARDTRMKGRFCFKNVAPGKYMLRVNTSGRLSQFTTMFVFVTIVRKKEKVTTDKMEITFDLAI